MTDLTLGTTCWAVCWPDGRMLADSTFTDEAHAWQVALGWPSAEEIAYAQAQGVVACRVTVKPVSEGDELAHLALWSGMVFGSLARLKAEGIVHPDQVAALHARLLHYLQPRTPSQDAVG